MLRHWIVLLVGSLALLVTLGGSAPAVDPASIEPFPIHSGYTCAGASPPTIGIPAIQPHLQTIPAYTADDVRRYLQKNGVETLSSSVRILRILFIKDQEVCERLFGEDPGLSPDALVCFVELRGIFFPRSYPPGVHPQPALYAYEVFDAKTGNFLMSSG